MTDGEQTFTIDGIVIHPDYDMSASRNDIAVLMLSGDVSFDDYAYPICLPEQNEKIATGSSCFVSGWGEKFLISNQMENKLFD